MSLRTISIKMYPDNIEKIILGQKTSTLRSERQMQEIGLAINESAIVVFGGIDFIITNIGLVHVDSVGGKDLVMKTEGFIEGALPKFNQTVKFLDGKCKLYYYVIEKYNGI